MIYERTRIRLRSICGEGNGGEASATSASALSSLDCEIASPFRTTPNTRRAKGERRRAARGGGGSRKDEEERETEIELTCGTALRCASKSEPAERGEDIHQRETPSRWRINLQ